MSYVFEFFATYWILAVVVEIAVVGFIVWAIIFHEQELVQIEDALIRHIRHRWRRWKFRTKIKVINKVRDVFLFVYLPYRRMKKRMLKRLLRQFGMRAVKCEQVSCYEILSRR